MNATAGASGPGTIDDLPDLAPLPASGASADSSGPATGVADSAGPVGNANGAAAGSQPISANPAAVDIIAGTGALGRLLGFDEESGIRLGGLWIGDASGVLSGGQNPGRWGMLSLTIADLNFDTDKLFGWKGGSIGMEYLNFTGAPINNLAGAFPGFDSLEAGPPFARNQLYELWVRQVLFDDKLIVRIGKSVPTYDFNNVIRPVPVSDPAATIPAVTSLAFTPVFVNPTMLGVIPGYYNSASGITVTVAPTKSTYMNYGFYDGNLAKGVQTGLEGPHFNGYYFHIGEIGFTYRLGQERKPGNFGVGVWGQTGKLPTSTGGTDNGANGVYLFGAQRLWFRRPGLDSSGVSGFYQFGANNSNALSARDYVGGGLTAFNLVPGRPDDSFGFGLAWTALNTGELQVIPFFPPEKRSEPLRSNQLMLQWYYQMKIVNGWFFQAALTDIPTPGLNASIPNALALTLRVTVLF
jgi:porin